MQSNTEQLQNTGYLKVHMPPNNSFRFIRETSVNCYRFYTLSLLAPPKGGVTRMKTIMLALSFTGVKVFDRQRDKERVTHTHTPISWSWLTPQMPDTVSFSASIQELYLALPLRWQKTENLGHTLLPSQVHWQEADSTEPGTLTCLASKQQPSSLYHMLVSALMS